MVFLAWGGAVKKILARALYHRIHMKYGCFIYYTAIVAKGFYIEHPIGVVIGAAEIGENFKIYQNATVGAQWRGEYHEGKYPRIGNNVMLTSGSSILGNVHIADDVVIGCNSVVVKDITESGIYAGSPVRRIK